MYNITLQIIFDPDIIKNMKSMEKNKEKQINSLPTSAKCLFGMDDAPFEKKASS